MILNKDSLRGAIPAIVTPFNHDSSAVDYPSLEKLIGTVLQGGCSGVVVCGSTGEAVTLSDDEYRDVIKTACAVVSAFGKGFCIAGIGSSSTARSAAMAEALGDTVDGLLLVAPPYNRPSQDGIVAHFDAVKKRSRAPIIAYNVPSRAAVQILPETIKKLVERDLAIGVKESSGSIDQVTDIASSILEKAALLSGEDSLVLPTMSLGGQGVISVTANVIPEKIAALVDACLRGDWERGRQLQFETLPLTRAMFMETNPIPVKAALAIKGVISTPAVRLPLLPASRLTVEKIRELIEA